MNSLTEMSLNSDLTCSYRIESHTLNMATSQSLTPIWLVSKGNVLASAFLATSRRDRRRGLMGVQVIEQPLVIDPCSWVHSLGMKTSIDVVYLNAHNVVISTSHLKPWRVGPNVRHSKQVIESAGGSIERWNIHIGDEIEVRHVGQ